MLKPLLDYQYEHIKQTDSINHLQHWISIGIEPTFLPHSPLSVIFELVPNLIDLLPGVALAIPPETLVLQLKSS